MRFRLAIVRIIFDQSRSKHAEGHWAYTRLLASAKLSRAASRTPSLCAKEEAEAKLAIRDLTAQERPLGRIL